MKITAYEVRDDEKDYLKQEAEKYGIEITLVPGPLTEDTINLANGADGITILGETKLKEDLMQEVAKRQIKVVATRTIGYDHIDLNAAKKNVVHICKGYYDPDGVAEYTEQVFKMFSGELEDVVIQFSKQLIGPVFEKFGEDTPMLSVNDTTCAATVHVQISPPFFGWLAQFGNRMQVISPPNVIDQYREHINNIVGGNVE